MSDTFLVADLNESEQRFARYLESHGYAWRHEPNYQAALGLRTPLETKPDFLVRRGSACGVCEVRQFDTTRIRDALEMAGGYMSTAPEVAYKSLRWGLVEKAQQLLPLAGAGVPLLSSWRIRWGRTCSWMSIT